MHFEYKGLGEYNMNLFFIIVVLILLYMVFVRVEKQYPMVLYSKQLILIFYISAIASIQVYFFVWIHIMLNINPNKILAISSILLAIIGSVITVYCLKKMARIAEIYYKNNKNEKMEFLMKSRIEGINSRLSFFYILLLFFIILGIYFIITSKF